MGAFGEDLRRLYPADFSITFEDVVKRFRAAVLAQKVELPNKNEHDKDELRCETHHAILDWVNSNPDISPSFVVGRTPELYARDCWHHLDEMQETTIFLLAEGVLVDALHYELIEWIANDELPALTHCG